MRMNVQPAIMNKKEVCRRLRCSPQTFERRMPELEQRGFPKRDTLLQGWPITKVEEFLHKRFHQEDDFVQEERKLIEKLNDQIID